jgi:protein-S-isoprenylcysteine O-methyltransferase Ste14
MPRRRFADLLLFGITVGELAILIHLTPDFTITDWIYVLQHVIVLGIALTRPAPIAYDHSVAASCAVLVAYAYPYAQVIYLNSVPPGAALWPEAGLGLVTVGTFLSLASLVSLGKFFGVRPALRGLATKGPYALVRDPMYLAYMLSDIGYNLQEWSPVCALLVVAGWVSLIYRIQAEERVLAQDGRWPAYVAAVRYRLIPGLW